MFVLDASVTVAWILPNEVNSFTEHVLDELRRSAALVPSIWPLEVGNVILVAERRGRISEAQAAELLGRLDDLPIHTMATPLLRATQQLLMLARQHNLSVYDASYLELAMREGLPLATQDERLRAAAQGVGVQLFSPPHDTTPR